MKAEKNPFAKRRKTETTFFPKYSGGSTSDSAPSPAASSSANTSTRFVILFRKKTG